MTTTQTLSNLVRKSSRSSNLLRVMMELSIAELIFFWCIRALAKKDLPRKSANKFAKATRTADYSRTDVDCPYYHN